MNIPRHSEANTESKSAIQISDLTRMLDTENSEPAEAMRWRWAIIQIAMDSMNLMSQIPKTEISRLWEEEARFRSSRLLNLALIESFRNPASARNTSASRWTRQSVTELGGCYRSVQQDGRSRSRGGEMFLHDMLRGLIGTYKPVMGDFNLRALLQPVLLDASQRRSLALFLNCITQGILERALQRGGAGHLNIALTSLGNATKTIVIQSSEPFGAIYDCPSHEIASKIAATLQGEFVCRKGSQSAFELRF